MAGMRQDKCGAATVLAVMSVLRDLEVDVEVRALLPVIENMIGTAIAPARRRRYRLGRMDPRRGHGLRGSREPSPMPSPTPVPKGLISSSTSPRSPTRSSSP